MLTGLAAVFFYLFSFVLLASAVMVIVARNPVHSVLFLILAFFNAAGLFLLSGAEFLALILLVVYVGAVAVLFLFVIMMLNIDFQGTKKRISGFGVVGFFIGGVLCAELLSLFVGKKISENFVPALAPASANLDKHLTNTQALGNILYTDYVFYFEIAGLVLLVAMIAAIVLTLHHREGVKRQSISAQVARSKDAIDIRKVELRKGL